MTFVTDPLSLALALGLLGPAAVDEHGVFDDGRMDERTEKADLAKALAEQLDGQVDANDDVVLTQTYTLDEA